MLDSMQYLQLLRITSKYRCIVPAVPRHPKPPRGSPFGTTPTPVTQIALPMLSMHCSNVIRSVVFTSKNSYEFSASSFPATESLGEARYKVLSVFQPHLKN